MAKYKTLAVWYHRFLNLFGLFVGVGLVYYSAIKENGFSGLLIATAMVILGTSCFLLLPIGILAVINICKYVTIFAFPLFFFYLIKGEGEIFLSILSWGLVKSGIAAVFFSVFAVINIITAIIAEKAGENTSLFPLER